MTSILSLPNELLFHIGSFLDDPCPAEQVCKRFKKTVARGCYERLYKMYITSPYITGNRLFSFPFMPIRVDQVEAVKIIYRNVANKLFLQGAGRQLLLPSHLEQWARFHESRQLSLRLQAKNRRSSLKRTTLTRSI